MRVFAVCFNLTKCLIIVFLFITIIRNENSNFSKVNIIITHWCHHIFKLFSTVFMYLSLTRSNIFCLKIYERYFFWRKCISLELLIMPILSMYPSLDCWFNAMPPPLLSLVFSLVPKYKLSRCGAIAAQVVSAVRLHLASISVDIIDDNIDMVSIASVDISSISISSKHTR